MSTLVKVARYHLVQPFGYLVLTWMVLAFSFAVNMVVFAITPVEHHTALTANGLVSVANTDGRYTGALSSFFILFLVLGVQSIGRSLPFGLTLGVSRRSYYMGTALLAVVLACADGLALTALVVTWSHGWTGVGHFFTGLTAAGVTGLLAVLAVALLAGGRATIRRATV